MESSSVVVKAFWSFAQQVQGSGHMRWNVVISQPLGWIPAQSFPSGVDNPGIDERITVPMTRVSKTQGGHVEWR